MRRSSALALLVSLAACGGGDGPTEPPTQVGPSVRVTAGAAVTDTVRARPVQALIAEVRDSSGRLVPNAIVRFEADPPTVEGRTFERAVYVCSVSTPVCGDDPSQIDGGGRVAVDTTDQSGRVLASVRLGTVAGTATVRLLVPELGVSTTASFTVQPGAPSAVQLSASEFAITVGQSTRVSASVVDAYGNARPDRPQLSVSGPPGITVSQADGTVTAADMGSFTLTATMGERSATAVVSAVPVARLLVWAPSGATVRLVDADGGNVRDVVQGVASDHGIFARLDPSRGRVVLHAATSAWGGQPQRIVAIDTTAANRLDVLPPGVQFVSYVRPLADGTTLYLARATGTGVTSVWRAAADGSSSAVATVPSYRNVYGGADISPDGTRLAYVATTADGWSVAGLHVLDIATGHTRLVAASGHGPRWSPTGDRLLYLEGGPGTFDEFTGLPKLVNADGSGLRSLGADPLTVGVAWSPDGTHVVARDATGHALRIVRVADERSVRLRFRDPTVMGPPSEYYGWIDYYQPDWR